MAATVRRRRALVALAVLLLATVIATGLALVTARRNAADARAAVTIQRAHSGQAVPSLKGRVTFLVIGSDSGAPKFGRGGTAAGGRADSIHLVVLDTGKRRGVSIGFPRDSYVSIPGHGTSKINAAMSFGGPALLIRTIEQLTGIKVDYYALTSFDGLTDLVNKVGGVTVGVDMNLVDTFQKQVAKDPTQVMKWLSVLHDEVIVDLPFPEMLRLALYAATVPPSRINNLVAPGVPGSAGAASVVRLQPAAFSLFSRVRHGQFG